MIIVYKYEIKIDIIQYIIIYHLSDTIFLDVLQILGGTYAFDFFLYI